MIFIDVRNLIKKVLKESENRSIKIGDYVFCKKDLYKGSQTGPGEGFSKDRFYEIVFVYTNGSFVLVTNGGKVVNFNFESQPGLKNVFDFVSKEDYLDTLNIFDKL